MSGGLLGSSAAAASAPRLAEPDLLPSPGVVLQALWELLGDSRFRGDLAATSIEVAVAFAIAAPAALSAGFLLGEKLRWGRIVNPFLHLALGVPQSVLLPLFILVFGVGFLLKVAFGITHAFFVIAVSTVAAVHSVPAGLGLAGRSLGATRAQIYLKIYLPAMLPLIIAGLRYGMILNIVGILLAEMYASQRGIGGSLLAWGERAQMPELVAATSLISVLTVGLNEIMRIWELRAGRWQRGRSPL